MIPILTKRLGQILPLPSPGLLHSACPVVVCVGGGAWRGLRPLGHCPKLLQNDGLIGGSGKSSSAGNEVRVDPGVIIIVTQARERDAECLWIGVHSSKVDVGEA